MMSPGESDHLIVSGRGAAGPAYISFTHSLNRGMSWSESVPISAITSPGCQAPIAGVAHMPSGMAPSVAGSTAGGPRVGAMITSPSGPGRSHLAAYVATAASNFTGAWYRDRRLYIAEQHFVMLHSLPWRCLIMRLPRVQLPSPFLNWHPRS